MLGYVTLGTNDLPRAAAFYDTLLAEIGAKRLMEFPGHVARPCRLQIQGHVGVGQGRERGRERLAPGGQRTFSQHRVGRLPLGNQ